MHPNAALIHSFYEAFDKRDAETMAQCYHKDLIFSDPVFGELRGPLAGDMWRMLCARATDLRVKASNVVADDQIGSAHWVATYSFGGSRRPVRNEIEARFEFREGAIARHDDTFGLWKWAGMALGPTGALLGWAPPIQARIRRDARRGLDAYLAKR